TSNRYLDGNVKRPKVATYRSSSHLSHYMFTDRLTASNYNNGKVSSISVYSSWIMNFNCTSCHVRQKASSTW
ncbi:unnamed protein product, partial [Allacma fusca]